MISGAMTTETGNQEGRRGVIPPGRNFRGNRFQKKKGKKPPPKKGKKPAPKGKKKGPPPPAAANPLLAAMLGK